AVTDEPIANAKKRTAQLATRPVEAASGGAPALVAPVLHIPLTKVRTVLRGAMQIIEDVKLPTDEVRKEFCDSHHALCCLDCGWESQIDPRNPNDIGRPLLMFLIHPCADIDHRDR
ncbi:MAG: hypothetical protein WA414_08555, partial [Acidobacteriaceae bacterium]